MLLAPPPSGLEITQTGDRTCVVLSTNELGTCQGEALTGFLVELAEEVYCHELHLDLSRVELLGATGLGKLVDLYHKMLAKGGSLAIHNVTPEVYEVFEVTRLTQLLDVHSPGAVGPA